MPGVELGYAECRNSTALFHADPRVDLLTPSPYQPRDAPPVAPCYARPCDARLAVILRRSAVLICAGLLCVSFGRLRVVQARLPLRGG